MSDYSTTHLSLVDKNGKGWQSTMSFAEFLATWKDLKDRKEWLIHRVLELEKQIRVLQLPAKREAILTTMKKMAEPHNRLYISNRVGSTNWDWTAWQQLVNSGEVEKVKRGMYQVKEPRP